jgi:hypothetical protein
VSAVADIFRQYGPEYLERHGDGMLPSHRKALRDILECRNRSCPKCQWEETEKWLDIRRIELLPVPCFHVVFTLPAELREIVRSNKEVLLSTLMQAAASSLSTLAKDPRYVGGMIGILAVP